MSDDIKKGLLGIIVDETEISKVMPEINSPANQFFLFEMLRELPFRPSKAFWYHRK